MSLKKFIPDQSHIYTLDEVKIKKQEINETVKKTNINEY